MLRSLTPLNSPAPLILAVALSVLATAGPARSMPQVAAGEGVSPGASVEGITEYVLDNGLRVLLFPDPSNQQITVNITYFVGSRHEGYGETGMAHLLEHLVFKGTPDHPDIPDELSDRGALPNGTTWFDRTNYFETFPANDDNLAWALDLEADRMVNSFIAKKDLDSEMTVVRNEWEAGENNPLGVLMKRTMSAAFDWHNYGNSTIGARSDIENVPIERLQAFYRRYYQPDNAMLVVAGRFEPETALGLIAQKFGAIPRPDRSGDNSLWTTYTREPAQDGERAVTLRRVGDNQYVMAGYHIPAGSHPDYAAVDVLSHVLGDVPGGRLYKGVVEPGLAANVGTMDFQLGEPGLMLAFSEVRKEDSLERAEQRMIEVFGQIASEPPSDEEIERAKTDLLKNIDLAFRDSRRIALALSEWAAMGDWRLFFLHRDRLEAVTSEDVAKAAANYFMPSNRTIARFVPVDETPSRAEIPDAPDVAALVADYAGREAVAEGEAFDPTPANVDARTVRGAVASGLRYALVAKETRGDTVTAAVVLRLGDTESLSGKATISGLTGAMLMRGTTTHTRQEISDEFDRLGAQAFVGGSGQTASARIQTTRANLVPALRLAAEVLRSPAFPESEWDLLKRERLAAIERNMSEPQALAFNTFARVTSGWPEDHPNYTPTFEQQREWVSAATLEEARALHAEFYGASVATASIVGDFDAGELAAVLEELFGDWSSPRPFTRPDSPYRELASTTIDIETPDKENAVFIAGQFAQMRDDHADYPAMLLGNYMLGQGVLNSRLAVRLRQQDGLSYGAGSNFRAHPVDDRATFQVFAIHAPQNRDAVDTAVREELARALADGFTDEEVAGAKQGLLENRQVFRANDSALVGQLDSQLYFGRTMASEAELEAKIAALTPQQIVEALRRHLDPDSLVVVRAGDFAGES